MGETQEVRTLTGRDEPGSRPAEGGRARHGRWRELRLVLLSVYAVLLISIFDALTGTGAVMGILLSIPILVVSAVDDRRAVWLVFGTAWLGFMLAAIFGTASRATQVADLLNRVFVILTLGASAYLGLLLQRRRLEAQAARDAAIDARDTNRLLLSLIAHDLRAPLATALHAFDYLRISGSGEEDEVIDDVRGRLRRSLTMIDAFLSIRQAENGTAEHDADRRYITGHQLCTILTEEVRAFESEARARDKVLSWDLSALEHGSWILEVLVLRQSLAILLDNAIRHAVAGPVTVVGTLAEGRVRITVTDSGPGLETGESSRFRGAGLGLDLCDALVRRSRGALEVARRGHTGTAFVLELPVEAAP